MASTHISVHTAERSAHALTRNAASRAILADAAFTAALVLNRLLQAAPST